MHDFLKSLETNDATQKEQKAAEKFRQHQITLLQQQITKLEECRDQLKNVVSQLHSYSVSYYVLYQTAIISSDIKYSLFISVFNKLFLYLIVIWNTGQMVQLLTVATDNCCICVCGLRSRDHVTEALFNLHWLPVRGRIEFKFKLCVLVYKSFNGIAPSYINDMLQPVTTLQQ